MVLLIRIGGSKSYNYKSASSATCVIFPLRPLNPSIPNRGKIPNLMGPGPTVNCQGKLWAAIRAKNTSETN